MRGGYRLARDDNYLRDMDATTLMDSGPAESETNPQKGLGYSYTSIMGWIISILFVIFVIWLLYAIVTRPDTEFIVGRFLMDVSPYTWAVLGLSTAFSLSVVGAGW